MSLAMMHAEVGDDVCQDDITTIKLEECAASMLGKEAGLFLPSGTMGNLVALLVHCSRGDEVILGAESHIFYYEVGGASALGGISYRTVHEDEFGKMDLEHVKKAIRGDDIHFPTTKLLCLENTHNRRGGVVLDLEYIKSITSLVREKGIATHLDGARIFNASTYLKCDVKDLVADFDSVQFCLSKGLGAPIGSILVGTKDFIKKARQVRKMLGGGMRQVGVLAAPGLIALTKMSQRLEDDHINCKLLAQGLSEVKGFKIDMSKVHTNIVYVDVKETGKTASEITALLAEKDILIYDTDEYRIRFVTHHQVDQEASNKVIQIVKEMFN